MSWLGELQVRGVSKIPSYFTPREVDRIRSQSILALTHPRFDKRSLQLTPTGFPALLFWPCSAAFLEISRRLKPIVQEVLGPNVKQLNQQYYYRLPGDGDSFQWHQDICFRIPKEKFIGIETRYLQTAMVIDHMNKLNGGIEFIHGSHLLGERNDLVPRDGSERGLRGFERRDMAGEIMEANPGDLLLWSVLVIHGSEENRSARSRSYLMNGYAASDAVLSNEFPVYLSEGNLAL